MGEIYFDIMNNLIHIAPSVLAADFCHLEDEVKKAEAAGADRIHCDIMDGVFVPNISFGPMVVAAIKKCVSIPLDVHLMIVEPQNYIKIFADAGADVLIVHAEVCSNLGAVLDQIHSFGIKAGVSVNPDKPVELFLPQLAQIDQVLIMTVHAGFGGQSFMAETLPKIRTVYSAARAICKPLDIEVDGGINHDTVQDCAQAGANVFVAGSYVFGHDNYRNRIDALRSSAMNGQKEIGG
jgi:ribulose-phosphate 3-epimerase